MKKITLCIVATMLAATSFAQDFHTQQRREFKPEDIATWQTNMLQQALQLDSMQYQVIFLMNYADAVTMQDSMKARRERAEKLRAEGFYIPAIRPPTVPEGTSRLRISLTADANLCDIERVLKIIREF